ncbi:MAG TPA: hypothetical protein VF844_04935 [Ktedonobacteraceae bacterium]
MKRLTRRFSIIPLALVLLSILASCSPGHLGSNEIAFVRDGHLWTIDPDGSNAFEVVADKATVIGYGWSPNHQIFAFRTLDSNFAKSAAGQHLAANPVTGLTSDVPSILNTVGIDGGTPIPIALASSDLQHSNAWWNPTGNRLLYREEATAPIQNPGTQSWWASQNDQPLGIARQLLPYTFSIPSISASNSLTIGNSSQGVFTTTLAGTQFQFVILDTLPGHPLPAGLERVLWQPAHQNPGILYAIVPASTTPQSSGTTSMTIQLVLRDPHGQTTTIATCACTQFAWSPDGNYVLYSTGATYTILSLKDLTSFSVPVEDGSVPYWSPDSQFILLDGLHRLQLVSVAGQRQLLLLNDSSAGPGTIPSTIPDARALLQPISNNIWASDSRHFLFLTRDRLSWQGKRLSSGKGLYTASIDDQGNVQGSPLAVDTGNDSQAGWTYEDPNTSFLF